MTSKFPVKPGYHYWFHRTGLGEPLHHPGIGFDISDPNCLLLGTEYNSLHDPHLKSFYHKGPLLSKLKREGYISYDNKVTCSLLEFNQYNDYIKKKLIELNKEYLKDNIAKQFKSFNRCGQDVEIERLREKYKHLLQQSCEQKPKFPLQFPDIRKKKKRDKTIEQKPQFATWFPDIRTKSKSEKTIEQKPKFPTQFPDIRAKSKSEKTFEQKPKFPTQFPDIRIKNKREKTIEPRLYKNKLEAYKSSFVPGAEISTLDSVPQQSTDIQELYENTYEAYKSAFVPEAEISSLDTVPQQSTDIQELYENTYKAYKSAFVPEAEISSLDTVPQQSTDIQELYESTYEAYKSAFVPEAEISSLDTVPQQSTDIQELYENTYEAYKSAFVPEAEISSLDTVPQQSTDIQELYENTYEAYKSAFVPEAEISSLDTVPQQSTDIQKLYENTYEVYKSSFVPGAEISSLDTVPQQSTDTQRMYENNLEAYKSSFVPGAEIVSLDTVPQQSTDIQRLYENEFEAYKSSFIPGAEISLLDTVPPESTDIQIKGEQDLGTFKHVPALADATNFIPLTGNAEFHEEETISGIDTSEIKTISLPMSIPKEDALLQMLFQEIGPYLTDTAEKVIEIVFDKITFDLIHAASGSHTKFKPEKTMDKEKLCELTNKSAWKYFFSKLEVMSASTEIVENILGKWQATAVEKITSMYDHSSEGTSVFRTSYKFFDCSTNQEAMYKAALRIAMESVLETREDIVMIVISHLEAFLSERQRMILTRKPSVSVTESLKETFPKTESKNDSMTDTALPSDIFTSSEQGHSFLQKELQKLLSNIDRPGHKVHLSIKQLIKKLLDIVTGEIDHDITEETGRKIVISNEEKFLLYTFLEEIYKPSKKEVILRNYSSMWLSKPHGSPLGKVSDHQAQYLQATIEEVNVPGMSSYTQGEKNEDELASSGKTSVHSNDLRLEREYFTNQFHFMPEPLGNWNTIDCNCFVINMFNKDRLVYSQKEFHRPLKTTEFIVSETLYKILRDLKYSIPDHLYDFIEVYSNRYDVSNIMKCQKDIDTRTLLLPSDISSFSHYLIEYILKMLHMTSSYRKFKQSFSNILSQLEAEHGFDTMLTSDISDDNQFTAQSDLYSSQEHTIFEDITQSISAKMESFILLKFKTYLRVEEIVTFDVIQSMQSEIWMQTKFIVTGLLNTIEGSIIHQDHHWLPTCSKTGIASDSVLHEDKMITKTLLSSILDSISKNKYIISNVSLEKYQLASLLLFECLNTECTLHNIYESNAESYFQKSKLLDQATAMIDTAFKQIMISVDLKFPSSVTPRLPCFETDLCKCCQETIGFLQTEIHILSRHIIEDLLKSLCAAKQNVKENTYALQYRESSILDSFAAISLEAEGINAHFAATLSESILTDVFRKFMGFMSLALKVMHPLSKNVADEIYFPGSSVQHHVLYGTPDQPKKRLESIKPKTNLYMHSNVLCRSILRVIQNQLGKTSNDIRLSLLDEFDGNEASGTDRQSFSDINTISPCSSCSQHEGRTFKTDNCLMQKIELNVKQNILQNLFKRLETDKTIKSEITYAVKSALFTFFRQLLNDLSLPLQITCPGQQLLSETFLTFNEEADSSFFTDIEVDGVTNEIINSLSECMYSAIVRHTTGFSTLPDYTYSAKKFNLVKPIFTKLQDAAISKIEALFCQLTPKTTPTSGSASSMSQMSQTEREIPTFSLAGTQIEDYAREVADTMIEETVEKILLLHQC